MIIGIDFDNTIADYDDLMHKLAVEERWIDKNKSARKQDIRDHIRSLDNGEIKWQKLQAKAYGPCMNEAKLIDGVADFLAACRSRGIKTFIVSHKSQFAAQDEGGVNLHTAALSWMKSKSLNTNVFFESQRQKKIERIIDLGCTHFIDDLEEMFKERVFPSNVEKILFAPHGGVLPVSGMNVCKSWKEIYEYFFNG